MKMKNNYDLLEFDNQQEYARYMFKSILNNSISRIVISGYSNEVLPKIIFKFTEYNNVKEVKEALKELKPLIVIKCNYCNCTLLKKNISK